MKIIKNLHDSDYAEFDKIRMQYIADLAALRRTYYSKFIVALTLLKERNCK